MDLSQTGWGVVFASDIDPAVKAALNRYSNIVRSKSAIRAALRPSKATAAFAPAKAPPTGSIVRASVLPSSTHAMVLRITSCSSAHPRRSRSSSSSCWTRNGASAAYILTPRPNTNPGHVPWLTTRPPPVFHPHAAMWMTRHAGDAATTMLLSQVGTPFVQQGLGAEDGYTLHPFVDAQATKEQLANILHGTLENGPPAVLFTGSHGLEWSSRRRWPAPTPGCAGHGE